jgi:hypothetical protein
MGCLTLLIIVFSQSAFASGSEPVEPLYRFERPIHFVVGYDKVKVNGKYEYPSDAYIQNRILEWNTTRFPNLVSAETYCVFGDTSVMSHMIC